MTVNKSRPFRQTMKYRMYSYNRIHRYVVLKPVNTVQSFAFVYKFI